MYRLSCRRAKVSDWVISAMNSIGEKSIGFEDQTAETIDPEDLIEAPEHGKNGDGDIPELVGEDDVEDFDEAIRVLEEADLQDSF